MATKNDVTGDFIASRGSSEAFRSNWDAIFGKKKEVIEPLTDAQIESIKQVSAATEIPDEDFDQKLF